MMKNTKEEVRAFAKAAMEERESMGHERFATKAAIYKAVALLKDYHSSTKEVAEELAGLGPKILCGAVLDLDDDAIPGLF